MTLDKTKVFSKITEMDKVLGECSIHQLEGMFDTAEFSSFRSRAQGPSELLSKSASGKHPSLCSVSANSCVYKFFQRILR